MYKHILGWKTNKKIIVFESDDWGSFRFKNKAIRDKYLPSEKSGGWMHYNDCFESYEDLNALTQVLYSVKDKNNKPAAFTFLMNPANPDFKKIEESNFEHYYYENFLQTLEKRQDGKDIFKWYKSALRDNLIEVGFHGREHLNELAWMNDLQANHKETIEGFHNRVWGHGILNGIKTPIPHRSTFALQDLEQLKNHKINIKEGITLLNDTFSQKTTYFLPPDGPYHLKLNKTLQENGIKYMGLAKKHSNPLENEWYNKKLFWLGKKTKDGLKIITRNVTFEPGSKKFSDWCDVALNNIANAFKYNTPAVVSTHRANYVGGLNPQNRENNLKQLSLFLKTIVQKWPDVEFLTSTQLGNSI